ncbi:MAG: alpha/beta family hydrolase [Verrucomicrobiota bacterium]
MNIADPEPVTIPIDSSRAVSGLLRLPDGAQLAYVLAHGAGAGMAHPFLEGIARGLADRGIATLRYQFLYMEHGSKRPDQPKVAQAAVRAAVAFLRQSAPELVLFAGGRSFGGRMTSQAQADSPLNGVRGLIFLGFPLHPAGQPGRTRAEHLSRVSHPMLFLQGTRDELAQLDLLQAVVKELGNRATLKLLENADHSFHVPARTGRKDSDIRAELLDSMAEWMVRNASAGAREQVPAEPNCP